MCLIDCFALSRKLAVGLCLRRHCLLPRLSRLPPAAVRRQPCRESTDVLTRGPRACTPGDRPAPHKLPRRADSSASRAPPRRPRHRPRAGCSAVRRKSQRAAVSSAATRSRDRRRQPVAASLAAAEARRPRRQPRRSRAACSAQRVPRPRSQVCSAPRRQLLSLSSREDSSVPRRRLHSLSNPGDSLVAARRRHPSPSSQEGSLVVDSNSSNSSSSSSSRSRRVVYLGEEHPPPLGRSSRAAPSLDNHSSRTSLRWGVASCEFMSQEFKRAACPSLSLFSTASTLPLTVEALTDVVIITVEASNSNSKQRPASAWT